MIQSDKNLSNISNNTDFLRRNNITIIEELIKKSKLWIVDKEPYLIQSGFRSDKTSGYFMSFVIQELYSIYFKSNTDQKQMAVLIHDSTYHDEIKLYNEICSVIGISYEFLLFTSNENNMARNYMRERFFNLTKDCYFWDRLEQQLDLYIENRKNLEFKQIYLNNIVKILQNATGYAIVNGVLDEKDYKSKRRIN